MTKKEGKPRRPSPPYSGFAIVASFWLWGALLFCAPTYLDISGTLPKVLTVLGWISITISLLGAGVELNKILKNEAFGYWGVSMLAILPAALVHLFVVHNQPSTAWTMLAKVLVLVLLALGGSLFLYGFSYLFWKQEDPASEQNGEASPEMTLEKQENRIKLVGAIIVAVLSLVTAILKLIAVSP